MSVKNICVVLFILSMLVVIVHMMWIRQLVALSYTPSVRDALKVTLKNSLLAMFPQADTPQDVCPHQPIVAALDGGRLGNKIWEFVAALGMSQLLNRPGYVQQAILDDMGRIYSNLSLPALEGITNCSLELGEPQHYKLILPLDTAQERYAGKHLLLDQYIFLPELFPVIRAQLNREFRIRPDLAQQVEETFASLAVDNRAKIGVHVRRGDYANLLKKYYKMSLVNDTFFKASMSWFRKNLNGSLSFVVVSDDPEWCREHLGGEKDVVVASKSVHHDLALLSMCDHVIFDYGTFGLWGALVVSERGGHVVTLDLQHKKIATLYLTWHLVKVADLPKLGSEGDEIFFVSK